MTKKEILEKIDTELSVYRMQRSIVGAIRRAYEKIKHHKQLTAAIVKEIQKELPGCRASYDRDNNICGLVHIRACIPGLLHEREVFFCMNRSKVDENWRQALEDELEIWNQDDYIENMEHEKTYIDKLMHLDAAVKELRDEAAALKKGYIPVSAKRRCEACFWDDISYTVKELFPNIFPKRS